MCCAYPCQAYQKPGDRISLISGHLVGVFRSLCKARLYELGTFLFVLLLCFIKA
jgi:hypothetical protein